VVVPTATYTVEVDFENATGGAGVYQAASGTATTYSGSATTYTVAQAYAQSATATFGGTFDNVTRDATRVEIVRGRDDVGGPMQPGLCRLTLQRVTTDAAAPGPGGRELYNPASTTSPLSPYYTGSSPAKVDPGIVPLRPLRVTMTVSGTARVLFFGWITSWQYDRDTGSAQIVARDMLWKLSKVRPAFTQAAGETTASAIGRLLDYASWSAPDDRSLNPTIQGVSAGVGKTLPASSFSPDGVEKTGFELLDDLLTGSRGLVYCAGNVVRHEDYPARSLRKAADVTLADVAFQYDPGFEVE
jgi:hypothetical protein